MDGEGEADGAAAAAAAGAHAKDEGPFPRKMWNGRRRVDGANRAHVHRRDAEEEDRAFPDGGPGRRALAVAQAPNNVLLIAPASSV